MDLTFADVEGDVVGGAEAAEFLAEVNGLECRGQGVLREVWRERAGLKAGLAVMNPPVRALWVVM
ncbi:hypothetical protein GCM10008939_16500 [Deinococcus aquiradiocola]|uniref:Uncharacterized protein n=1 Tax=Deinococcus aquiradiocola TaxID=393059 RepID=A0A917PEA7_9DEIO|nr:hypothetical protein GCM10008939_16500 [Deinococcus aquiradiocola]